MQRNAANGPIAHKGWAELHYIIEGSAVAEVRHMQVGRQDLVLAVTALELKCESRILKLSRETPARLMAFDLLAGPDGETCMTAELEATAV